MIWGAFSFHCKTPLVWMIGKQTSKTYIGLLETTLNHFTDNTRLVCWVCYQDNCQIHVSQLSKIWFSRTAIRLIDWRSSYRDLNPMENLWCILAKQVSRGGRQFVCTKDFFECFKQCWAKISGDSLKSLVLSMKNRPIKVLEKQGDTTHF